MRGLRVCLWLLMAVVGGVTVAAQGARFEKPERIERATVTDENGLIQWAEYKAPKCRSCKGTGKMTCVTCARFGDDATICPECKRNEKKEAACRACAGKGALADPLQQVPCAGCMGASFLLCTICGGGGRLKINKAKRWSDCPGCRGAGGYKCQPCNGKRVLAAVVLKPSLAEAPADKLQKALKTVDATLAKFEVFNPAGGDKARKEVKALTSALTTAKTLHPAFKKFPKAAKTYMGKILSATNFQGHEEHEAAAMTMIKKSTEYYLKHQKRMLELALKRAEANAKLGGK